MSQQPSNPQIHRLIKKSPQLRDLLAEWVSYHHTLCRRDHHGQCQEHFFQTDCIVARTRKLLEEIDGEK